MMWLYWYWGINMADDELAEDMWKIVRARVLSMSPNLRLSIGGLGTMTKEQLVEHIDNRDPVGKILLRAHENYIKSFKQEAETMFS